MDKELVFIASGGRTGTKFLGDMLGQCIDDCYSEHEPDLVGWRDVPLAIERVRRFGLWQTVIGKALGKTGVRVIGERYRAGTMPRAEAIERLRDSRARYHASIGVSLIVESYPRWWMVADLIPDAFPDARVVGIVRDPSDWIASYQRYQPARFTGGELIRMWHDVRAALKQSHVRMFRFEDLFGPDPDHMRELVEHIANGRPFTMPDRSVKVNASR